MARLAEASGTMIRLAQPDLLMTHSQDELTTARAYRAVAELVPGISTLIDCVWRHQITSARTYFEHVIQDSSASVTCGVGFADLSGFTALTQLLSPTELSDLLIEFSGTVSDVVHADRWTSGEVHRRRGDVGEFDAGAAGESRCRPGRTPASARGGVCKSAPASATARCWPSAVTTSATR